MTVRTSPRPGLPVDLRDKRGSSALIARYIRELSTQDSTRRRDRQSHPHAAGALMQRGRS
jgi:hypothetical protein